MRYYIDGTRNSEGETEMSARDDRRAREAAEQATQEAARLTQEQANALATQIVATSGQARPKVRIDAATAHLFETSQVARWTDRGIIARGSLADGRGWQAEITNRWSGAHLLIG